MKIFVLVDGDFTVRLSGSHSRFSDLIGWLSDRLPCVAVYSWRNHLTLPWTEAGEARFAEMFPGVELVLEDGSWVGRILTRFKNAALTVAPQHARLWLSLQAPGMPLMRGFLADANVRLVVSRTDLLSQINGFPVNPAVVDTHDISFVNKSRSSGAPIYALSVLSKMRREFSSLGLSAGVIAISASEYAIFSTLIPSVRSLLIPDFRSVEARSQVTHNIKYDLLFVGSDYHFNVSGLIKFLRDNLGWANRYRLAIAGTICAVPEIIRIAAENSSVSLLGYVENLPLLYSEAKIAISPVSGTGLKIKILDALHARTPVLASPESVEGLPPGYEGAVALLTAENARAILDDDDALFAARQRAADYVVSLAADSAKTALLKLLLGEAQDGGA